MSLIYNGQELPYMYWNGNPTSGFYNGVQMWGGSVPPTPTILSTARSIDVGLYGPIPMQYLTASDTYHINLELEYSDSEGWHDWFIFPDSGHVYENNYQIGDVTSAGSNLLKVASPNTIELWWHEIEETLYSGAYTAQPNFYIGVNATRFTPISGKYWE